MKSILFIQGSLNPESKTAVTLAKTREVFAEHFDVDTLDLRDYELPFCDGRKEYAEPVPTVAAQIAAADGIVVGMPVYCYSVSGALKNLIDLTSSSFEYKPLGIVLHSGTAVSYLAADHLQRALAFESWMTPLMPLVATSAPDVVDGAVKNERAHRKMNKLKGSFLRVLGG